VELHTHPPRDSDSTGADVSATLEALRGTDHPRMERLHQSGCCKAGSKLFFSALLYQRGQRNCSQVLAIFLSCGRHVLAGGEAKALAPVPKNCRAKQAFCDVLPFGIQWCFQLFGAATTVQW